MSKGIQPLDRRDVERVLKAVLHGLFRDDVQVEINYLVTLKTDEETFVNAVIDPWQPFPRHTAKNIVTEGVARLNKMNNETPGLGTTKSGEETVPKEVLEGVSEANQIVTL